MKRNNLEYHIGVFLCDTYLYALSPVPSFIHQAHPPDHHFPSLLHPKPRHHIISSPSSSSSHITPSQLPSPILLAPPRRAHLHKYSNQTSIISRCKYSLLLLLLRFMYTHNLLEHPTSHPASHPIPAFCTTPPPYCLSDIDTSNQP
jgi:hypothetical protein